MEPKRENSFPTLTTIGVDIGKDVFHVVGFDAEGKIALRRKIKRLALADTFRRLPPCIVGMEACLSAHFVSRTLRQLGHEPRIIPAIYVKPFAKGKRTITTTPRRLPKQPCGRTCNHPFSICDRFRPLGRLAPAITPCVKM